MPESLTIAIFPGRAVEVPILRSSRAKKLRMRHSPRTGFTLTVPEGLARCQIDAMAPAFLKWMRHMEAARQILPAGPLFPEQVHLPQQGLAYKTEKWANLAGGRRLAGSQSLLLTSGAKRVLVNPQGDTLAFYGHIEDEELLAEALRAWVRRLAECLLPQRLMELAAIGGYGDVKTIVRGQKGRWGSCTRHPGKNLPTISLNWRGLLLEPPLFDHLCRHELAHLRHMGHSQEFHAELERNSPGSRQKEKALNTAWRNLPIWAQPR